VSEKPPHEVSLPSAGPWKSVLDVPLGGVSQVALWVGPLPIELRLVRGTPGAEVVTAGPYTIDPGAPTGWPPPRVQVPPQRRLQARRVGVGDSFITLAFWRVCCDETGGS